MKAHWIAAATLTACGALGLPAPAVAFTLRESNSGAPVRWHVAERSVRIDSNLVHAGGGAEARAAVVQALTAWASVEGSPFEFEPEKGFRNGLGMGERLDGVTDVSLIRDGWELDASFLAITLVTYDPASGEIWDADVVLNGADHEFGAGAGQFDAASVLTHEIGHLVGLGHSDVGDATMYAASSPGETDKRSLAADDELGFQALYFGQPMDGGAACSVAPAPRSGGTLAGWIALCTGAWLLRRRQGCR